MNMMESRNRLECPVTCSMYTEIKHLVFLVSRNLSDVQKMKANC